MTTPADPTPERHHPTTPVQCACGWRETDPGAGTWAEHFARPYIDALTAAQAREDEARQDAAFTREAHEDAEDMARTAHELLDETRAERDQALAKVAAGLSFADYWERRYAVRCSGCVSLPDELRAALTPDAPSTEAPEDGAP